MDQTTKSRLIGLNEAQNYYQELGIHLPYIPHEMKGKISEIQPGVFGSRTVKNSIYDLDNFLKEVLAKKKVENYVLFGVGRHGFNSQAIQYYAVNEYLALFFQLRYGSVIESPEATKDRIESLFSTIEPFFNAIRDAANKGALLDKHRLLVIESDFYGKGWGWIREGQEIIWPTSWHTGNLNKALNAIP